jgi:hypothetical protein
MAKKRTLTRQEEFEIMKLVLDKFLWAGLFVLLYGLYLVLRQSQMAYGFWIMVGGAFVLLLFMALIIKEYEIGR